MTNIKSTASLFNPCFASKKNSKSKKNIQIIDVNSLNSKIKITLDSLTRNKHNRQKTGVSDVESHHSDKNVIPDSPKVWSEYDQQISEIETRMKKLE